MTDEVLDLIGRLKAERRIMELARDEAWRERDQARIDIAESQAGRVAIAALLGADTLHLPPWPDLVAGLNALREDAIRALETEDIPTRYQRLETLVAKIAGRR